MNFRDWFIEKVQLNQGRPCVHFHDDVITYDQLNLRVNKAANAFYKLGIRKGDKVAFVLPNCLEFLYCWFGLAKIGAVSVFVNNGMKSESLSYLLSSSDSETMIIDQSLFGNYSEIAKDARMKKIICLPEAGELEAQGAEISSFNQIFAEASADEPPEVEIDRGDWMGFMHTAGTTGLPKWCILSHGAYINAGESFRDYCLICKNDVLYDALPLFHANPQDWYVMPALAGNASFVVTEKFSVSKFSEQVREYKATMLVMHFAPIAYLLKQPPSPADHDHNVRIAGPVINRTFMERFNIPVVVGGYGSTEVCSNICSSKFFLPISHEFDHFGERIHQFCGPDRHDIEIKIFDEKDNEVETGTIGEICVKPKKEHIMFDGYYKMPDKTKEAFRNGYFHTGDRGYKDADANLYFADRQADSISVKGEWVHIDEVEAVINLHPDVAESAVVGVKGEVGSDVLAYVELKEGVELDHAELLKHCESRLARFMIPRYIKYVKEFPRTAGTEKIQRSVLKDRGIGDAWDREKAGYKLSR